jgi:hypothetical protein
MGANGANQQIAGEQSTLLLSVAEQLKQPLLYIARSSELGLMDEAIDHATLLRQIESHAAMALRLVDSYMLGMDILQTRADLELESMSLSSLLTDIAHELTPLARQYDVELELGIDGRYGPVMSHPAALRAALHSLASVIVALPMGETRGAIMRLGAHRGQAGIVTGVYHSAMARLPQARDLLGGGRDGRRQPLTEIGGGSAAGVFVAQYLFDSMRSPLQLHRHHGLQGFAAPLQLSKQLALL